jgi:hypothetical protein
LDSLGFLWSLRGFDFWFANYLFVWGVSCNLKSNSSVAVDTLQRACYF